MGNNQNLTQSQFQQNCASLSQKYPNVSPGLISSVAQQESGQAQFYPNGDPVTSPAGALGIMQVMPATGESMGYTYDQLAYDPNANMDAGAQYLSNQVTKAGGDVPLGLAAYYSGPASNAVLQDRINNNYGKLDPGQDPRYPNGRPGVADYIGSTMGRVTEGPSFGMPTPDTTSPGGVLPYKTATDIRDLVFAPPSVSYASLFPSAIVNTGLDETPWYTDTSLVTGNPKVRGSVTPVVFEVLLHDRQDVYLPVAPDGATTAQNYPPMQIQLNASIKTFSVSSKHVFFPQRTRTGWHITMWGMQADTIEGQCTTGVFMNQLGLTDFFSTAQVSQDLIDAVTTGFQELWTPNVAPPQAVGPALLQAGGPTGQFAVAPVKSNLAQLQTLLSRPPQSFPSPDANEMFRVTAQDAFVEFLSLFKMNGIRWFYNKDVEAEGQGMVSDQVGIDEWSPELAASATQMNGRINDVMSRGPVLMKLKGNTYMGYFKSLSWQMSADKPFTWDFSFVFQVERTLSFVFSPAG